MLNSKLKIIKLMVVAVTAVVIFLMIDGMSVLRNNYYSHGQFLGMQINYVENKIAYAQESDQGIFSIPSIFSSVPNTTIHPKSENAKSIPVLLYHGVIADPNWQPDGVNIRLSTFRDQMFALKEVGYHTITLSEFADFMNKKKELPEKSILITFDDGRKDSYYPVDPILKTLGFNAVMFVITGRSLGDNNEQSNFHLSQTELTKMLESGRWELGSHTQNGHDYEKIDSNGKEGHFLTDKLWLASENRLETDDEYKQRIYQDLSNSASDLKDKLGVTPLAFAYPFGDYGNDSQNYPASQEILMQTVRQIFPFSFYQVSNGEFPDNYPGRDPALIKRIDVNESMSVQSLLELLAGGEEKSIPFQDTFYKNQGWLKGWGSYKLENELLVTGASPSEDSGLTFLNGGFLWKDYHMIAKVKIERGSSFALIARYQDPNNYVSCDFNKEQISLNEHIDGKESAIKETVGDFSSILSQDTEADISVEGNSASCSLGGKEIAAGPTDPRLSHGGIAIKTWDNAINNNELLVKQLDIAALP